MKYFLRRMKIKMALMDSLFIEGGI